MASPTRTIEIADLVICSDERLASDFGLEGRIGLVAESRRNDARVVYLAPGRSVWIPRPAMRRATAAEAERSPLGLASELFRRLGGKEIEVETVATGGLRLVIGHGAVTPDLLDAIRAHLGARLIGWRLRPAGLSKIQSLIELSGPPA